MDGSQLGVLLWMCDVVEVMLFLRLCPNQVQYSNFQATSNLSVLPENKNWEQMYNLQLEWGSKVHTENLGFKI